MSVDLLRFLPSFRRLYLNRKIDVIYLVIFSFFKVSLDVAHLPAIFIKVQYGQETTDQNDVTADKLLVTSKWRLQDNIVFLLAIALTLNVYSSKS